MPPQRPRTGVDDSRSETSSTKEKQTLPAPSGVSKSRRVVSTNLTASTSASTKGDAASKTATNGTSAAPNLTALDTTSPINWLDQPFSLLHSYRHAYRLQTPSAFTHPVSQIVLSRGIGRRSPTMVASRRAKRAQKASQPSSSLPQSSSHPHADKDDSGGGNGTGNGNGNRKAGFGGGKAPKEQLAMAVRKHFNAMGLNESETMVRFAYVGSQSRREFRQRFRP